MQRVNKLAIGAPPNFLWLDDRVEELELFQLLLELWINHWMTCILSRNIFVDYAAFSCTDALNSIISSEVDLLDAARHCLPPAFDSSNDEGRRMFGT